MNNRVYPTEFGMPVPFEALELPPSELDLSNPINLSNHHYNFTARYMGRLLITQTSRDLEFQQEMLPNDRHNLGKLALHYLYEPPEPPTILQAMDRLDIARQTGERMNVRVEGLGYVKHDISPVHWKQIEQEYNREAN